jgi:hypothetical protein
VIASGGQRYVRACVYVCVCVCVYVFVCGSRSGVALAAVKRSSAFFVRRGTALFTAPLPPPHPRGAHLSIGKCYAFTTG